MTIAERQEQLLQDLSIFQDWTERYEYVIGLGRKIPEMPADRKTDDKLIEGCQSRVWLEARLDNGRVHYTCLLYTSPSPRDQRGSRMPSSA